MILPMTAEIQRDMILSSLIFKMAEEVVEAMQKQVFG